MTILNCLPNAKELDKETYEMVLEYCRLTSFFIDISKTVLNGASVFPNEKIKSDYKPEGMEKVINFVEEEELQEEDLAVCKIEKPEKEVKKEVSSTVLEENKGFDLDIDGIKGMLQPIKKINKKDLIKKSENKTQAKSKSMKRYPSLMQKHFYDDNTQDPESSPTNQTAAPTEHFIEIPVKTSQIGQSPNKQQETNSANSNKSPQKLGINLASTNRSTPQKSPASKTETPSKAKQTTSTFSSNKQASPTKKETGQKQTIPNKQETNTKESPQKSAKDHVLIQPKLLAKDKVESPGLPSQVRSRDTPVSSTVGSKVQIGSNKNLDKGENPAPEKKTYIKEFDMEVIGKKELEQLRELYPTSTKIWNQHLLIKRQRNLSIKLKISKQVINYLWLYVNFLNFYSRKCW